LTFGFAVARASNWGPTTLQAGQNSA